MKTAQESLADLAHGTTQAFPNIQRAEMVDGLKERLAKPSAISQRNTSLCGPASLMYNLARSKDAAYSQYVVDLYQTGTAKIGKLTIKPGNGCRNYGASAANGIHPVDWVSLAGLRDSENDAIDYDSPSAKTGGITMPGDLLDWFKDAGFSKDKNETNLVWTKAIGDLTEAGAAYHLVVIVV